MMHGCVVIDKPAGMTSHDVIAKCRKLLHIKKIGHTGTLDPDATGVLVVCIGQATKMIPYLEEADKGYEATIVFGSSTTTLDAAGEVTKTKQIDSLFAVDDALAQLTLVEELLPPQVSAVKVAGKKLYEYARKGQVVTVPARPMKVLELRVLEPLRLQDSQAVMKLYLKVTKGSYIRSMVQYLSDVLDIPAHLGSLRRTHSGNFDLSQAIALSEVTPEIAVIPIEQALGFPLVPLTPELAKEVSFGKPIPNDQQLTGYVTLMTTKAQAIYHAEGDWLIPDRIFVYENPSHPTKHDHSSD